MRVLAGTAPRTPAEKLTIANGIPVTIALQFSAGKRVSSSRGGPDQMFYTLTDGRVWYAELEVAELIDRLELGSREPFTICKYGRNEWEVSRPAEFGRSAAAPSFIAPPQQAPAPLPPQRETAPRSLIGGAASQQIGENEYPNTTPDPPTKLEHALRTAITAAAKAEKYGESIGYPVRFDADMITRAALTLVINQERGPK